MAKFTQEDKLIGKIESKDGVSRKLPSIQKEWRLVANQVAMDLVKDKVISQADYEEDKKWVDSELTRRQEEGLPNEKEYPSTVDAVVAIMKLFEQDEDSAAKNLEIIPVTTYDKLKSGVSFILMIDGKPLGVSVKTVATEAGARAVNQMIANSLANGNIDDLSTDSLKYVEADELRGKIVPKITFVLKKLDADKVADVVAAGSPKNLSDTEKIAKNEIKLELEQQIVYYRNRLEETIKRGDNPNLARLKIVQKGLEKFSKAF